MAKQKPSQNDDPEPDPAADSKDDVSSENVSPENESQLDETVQMETIDVNDDPNATSDFDPNETTVVSDSTNQTRKIENSDSSSASQRITVRRGRGNASRGTTKGNVKRTSKQQTDTTVKIGDEISRESSSADFSIMTSSEIAQTVNPRELSDQDASEWNSAVGDVAQSSEAETREIDGSYAEQRFSRLRRVDVAQLKSGSDSEFDYRLVRKLGQGGMGDVFVARQGSLDRLLALKLIKPLSGRKRDQLEKTGRLDSVEEERRQQFLSEAIVTGDLDHPNIVPIHDVGLTSENQLFYAMKRVVGTPWSDVIKEKSRDENLEILLKAADAIGFAHTRGVVHRDVKPENIMLGDFGVVMVMDWGLALLTSEYEKQESITMTSGLGGTPAFMAPEMATGPISKIGTTSDIYLLGATLFMIIAGKPPHFANNVTECLLAVRSNTIREFPPHLQGELMDVALRAMATNPSDRYPDVASFQQAIREYRSHAESISLATRAIEDLNRGKENQSYADLSRAAFRFEESLKSWSGNRQALTGLAETKILHAQAAYEKGDYDLGLSLLDEQTTDHQPIIEKLRAGIRERQSRSSRLALLRKVAVAMLAFIIFGGAVAIYNIKKQYRIAQTALVDEKVSREAADQARIDAEAAEKESRKAKLVAEQQRFEAELSKEKEEQQRLEAEKQRQEAIDAKSVAEEQRAEAQVARQQAVASREQALYEEYVSKIGLAKASLERNEVDGAKRILLELKATSPQAAENWEWRWLWHAVNQAASQQTTSAAVIDLSLARAGGRGIAALVDGRVTQFSIDNNHQIGDVTITPIHLPANARATVVAITQDGKTSAVGTNSGQIVLIQINGQIVLPGHTGRITDLEFSNDGILVSGSQDKTVRLWNSSDGRQLTRTKALWHFSPIRQLAVSGTNTSYKLAVAIGDDTNGRIELWNLQKRDAMITGQPAGSFDQHDRPVTAVAISIDGSQVASGDAGGNVMVWETAQAARINFAKSVRGGIGLIDDEQRSVRPEPAKNRKIPVKQFVDATHETGQLVSTAPSDANDLTAHDDVIRSIRFNSDGATLLTGSDDNTIKLWKVTRETLEQTFKGHGGWVVGADFVAGKSNAVISAGNDATIRSWIPDTHVGEFVSNRVESDRELSRATTAHRDEIWSATLSRDGSQMVTASRDHTARVMQIDPRTLAFTKITRLQEEILEEGSEFVAMSMELDRVNQRLYIGSADATIRIWDLDRGIQIGRAGMTGLNTSFVVARDGRSMLTGSSSPQVKAILWRIDPTGDLPPRVAHRLTGHHEAVTAFAISHDSQRLLTGDRDGRCILWDAKMGQPIGQPIDLLRGFRINAVSFTPNGKGLLVGADDEQLTHIDLQSRAIVSRFNHNGAVTELVVSPAGRRALTVSELITQDGFLTAATLWDLPSGQSKILDRTTDPKRDKGTRITSARFDETGSVVAVSHAATDKQAATIRLWEIDRDNLLSDDPLLVSARLDGKLISPKSFQRTFRLPAVLGTAEVALPIANQSMLTMNKNGVFLWNVHSKRLIQSYRPHSSLTEAAFSFDGKRIATASRSVKIWDPSTGRAIGKIETPHAGPVQTVQFAPQALAGALGATNYVFVTAGADRLVRLWSWDEQTQAAKQVRQFDINRDDVVVRQIRFSPDAEHLLVVGDGGIARWLDLRQPERSIVLDRDDAGDFISGCVSADGSVIAVGSTDHQVRVWKLPNGDEAIEDPTILVGHGDVIHDVKLIGDAPSRLRVLTASADDTARIWDPRLGVDLPGQQRRGREILSLRRHSADVTAIDATSDGSLMMTAARDGEVILWPAP